MKKKLKDITKRKLKLRIIKKLKKHIQDYSKGSEGIFERTSPQLSEALKRAKFLQEHFNPHQEEGPYTRVDKVVELLINIGNAKLASNS